MKLFAIGFVIFISFIGIVEGRADDFTVDDQFPGGNIIVESCQNNQVLITPDRHGSDRGECGNRYWCFRVRGAEGRKISFQFVECMNSTIYGHVTTRGPAVSRDGGVTWNWLSDGKTPNLPNSFEYAFGAEEKDVRFAVGLPYTSERLTRFLDALDKSAGNFRVETLCKTEKGRDVLKLRFGTEDSPKKIGVLICARHHANEVVSDYVVEGIVREALSKSETGLFMLANADFFVVPMVDWDGVEDGDQGKSRIPHDHNRDYDKDRYAAVRALKAQTLEWSKGKQVIVFDFHACSLELRGKRLHDPREWAHNMFFLVHSRLTRENEKKFGAILQDAAKETAVLYDGKTDVVLGNLSPSMSHVWFSEELHAIYSTSSEVPSCPASGRPHTEEELRDFGSALLIAVARFIKTLDTP